MLRLAFDFIITWRETRTRPNAYVGIADYIFQVATLLYLDGFKSQTRFPHAIKILVHCLNTKIYSFRLELLNEISFINKQIALVQFLVLGIVFSYGIEVSRDRILRHIPLTKIRFKIFKAHV